MFSAQVCDEVGRSAAAFPRPGRARVQWLPLCQRARYKWQFDRDGQSPEIDVPGRLTLCEQGTIVRAVLDGIGLAYVLGRHSVAGH